MKDGYDGINFRRSRDTANGIGRVFGRRIHSLRAGLTGPEEETVWVGDPNPLFKPERIEPAPALPDEPAWPVPAKPAKPTPEPAEQPVPA
jgi:hypothetical protein